MYTAATCGPSIWLFFHLQNQGDKHQDGNGPLGTAPVPGHEPEGLHPPKTAPQRARLGQTWHKMGNSISQHDSELFCHCPVQFKSRFVWTALPSANIHLNKCNWRHMWGIFVVFLLNPCCQIFSSCPTLCIPKNCSRCQAGKWGLIKTAGNSYSYLTKIWGWQKMNFQSFLLF